MRLTESLEHMPDNQRRAILLREWQGLSYHEIADELKLSQSAVETLIFRARRNLAANLESEDEQPGVLSRMRKALDAGALLAMLKGLFEGGAAVKVAAVAVAASGTVVVATAPPAPLVEARSGEAGGDVGRRGCAGRPGRVRAPAPAGDRREPRDEASAAEAAKPNEFRAGRRGAAAAVAAAREARRRRTSPRPLRRVRPRKQQPAARSNGNAGKAGKDKPKQARPRARPSTRLRPRSPSNPSQPPAAANGGQPEAREENDKGPKK